MPCGLMKVDIQIPPPRPPGTEDLGMGGGELPIDDSIPRAWHINSNLNDNIVCLQRLSC